MMKKIFTLVMLSILTVMNVNAAETTLWEGEWWFSWEAANTDEAHKGWNANANGVNFADYNEGDVFNFYLVKDTEHLFGNEYYNYRFDDSNWTVLPGCEATDATGAETKAKFVLTAEIKAVLASADFALHGHGLKLVKVTKGEEEQPVTDEANLWEGEWWFSWEAANTDEDHKGWNANANGINFADYDEGDVFNFYLVKDTEHLFGNEYYNYRFDDSNWTALPGCEATDATGAETKAKFVLTAEIMAVLASADFALHGHGLKLVKVTKVISSAGINAVVAVKNDNRYYNLNGQVVANPTKGLYIVNGKKVLVK